MDSVELQQSILQQVHGTKATYTEVLKPVDARFIKLEDLPSNFIPYSRKFLMVRPFSVLELKHIARAGERNNLDYITQAMQNCVDVDVNTLTIPDYFYLYYWFRIESYPSSPYYMEWVCDVPECKHENLSALSKNDIKIVYLNEDIANLDARLTLPCTHLLSDLTQAQQDRTNYAAKKDEDQCVFSKDQLILVEAAKWLKDGNTLAEKIALLEQQPDLHLYELAHLANKKYQYGVYEYTTVTCGGCGAKRRFRVTLDAPKFFPYLN